MSLFDLGTGVNWSDYTADSLAYAPNAGAVPVNRPAVETGGTDWGAWVDRLLVGAIAIRNSGQGGDARMTSYPGTGQYGLSYSGQAAAPAPSNMMPLLLMGGLALAAYLIVKG